MQAPAIRVYRCSDVNRIAPKVAAEATALSLSCILSSQMHIEKYCRRLHAGDTCHCLAVPPVSRRIAAAIACGHSIGVRWRAPGRMVSEACGMDSASRRALSTGVA